MEEGEKRKTEKESKRERERERDCRPKSLRKIDRGMKADENKWGSKREKEKGEEEEDERQKNSNFFLIYVEFVLLFFSVLNFYIIFIVNLKQLTQLNFFFFLEN